MSSAVNSGMGTPFHSGLGDAAHVICLFSCIAFAGMVARYFNDENDTFFDTDWKRYGFCVTNEELPLWNSHDLCLYVDSMAAVLLGILYLFNRKRRGMELPNQIMSSGIPGILFHGFGHGTISYAMRNDSLDEEIVKTTDIDVIREHGWPRLVPQIIFFLFLLKAAMPNMSFGNVALFALLARGVQALTPISFGFTYVQTVLLVAFSVNQLLRPKREKDFHYTLYPILVGIPLTFVGWVESTQCSAFVKDYLYGHLAYDAYIPASMLMWYTLCVGRSKQNAKVKEL